MDGEEAKQQEEEKEKPERDLTCSARAAVYLTAESILFVGTGLYAGHIWETSLRAAPMITSAKANPTPFATETVPRKPVADRVVQLTLSPTCAYLLVGFVTGQVWVVPLSNLDVHLEMLCGEMTKGSISSVSMTEDESTLVASAEDGSLTVNLLNPEAVKSVAERPAKRVRERVTELRQELEAAISRNELLPKSRQLIFVGGSEADKPATFVDPGYIQTLQQENEDRVVGVQEV